MDQYYISQVGTGLTPFEGMRYQRGHGLFSNFVRGRILPMLKRVLPYIGRTALDAGVNFAKNVSEGNDLKTSAKNVMKKKAFDLAEDAFLMVKKKTGNGYKRRGDSLKTIKANPKRRKTKSVKQSHVSLF